MSVKHWCSVSHEAANAIEAACLCILQSKPRACRMKSSIELREGPHSSILFAEACSDPSLSSMELQIRYCETPAQTNLHRRFLPRKENLGKVRNLRQTKPIYPLRSISKRSHCLFRVLCMEKWIGRGALSAYIPKTLIGQNAKRCVAALGLFAGI